MSKVFYCLLSLFLADLLSECWREVPDYLEVAKVTWEQFLALIIYYFVWEKQ